MAAGGASFAAHAVNASDQKIEWSAPNPVEHSDASPARWNAPSLLSAAHAGRATGPRSNPYLAKQLSWAEFDQAFGTYYRAEGRPAKPTRHPKTRQVREPTANGNAFRATPLTHIFKGAANSLKLEARPQRITCNVRDVWTRADGNARFGWWINP